MKKVVLAALRKKRDFGTYAELAAECQKHEGGEGMGETQCCAYLTGDRPIGDIHFLILCKVMRVKPEHVYTSRYLAGGRKEPVAA